MSQYLNFYVKSKNNEYVNIGNYSRSSVVYERGEPFFEYEKGTIVDKDTILKIISMIRDDMALYPKAIEEIEEHKKLIVSMNNSLEEKLEAIYDCERQLDETKAVQKDLEYAKHFYVFLLDIIDNYGEYSDNKRDDVLYAGIEWDPDYKEQEEE